jgi:hypothetical protein
MEYTAYWPSILRALNTCAAASLAEGAPCLALLGIVRPDHLVFVIKLDPVSPASGYAIELLANLIEMDCEVLTRFDVMSVVQIIVSRRDDFDFCRLAAAHQFALNAILGSVDRPAFEMDFFGDFLDMFANCDPQTASTLLNVIDELITQSPELTLAALEFVETFVQSTDEILNQRAASFIHHYSHDNCGN